MAAEEVLYFTPEEYLRREAESETKHEYYDGRIFAMAGAQPEHVYTTANTVTTLKIQTRGRPCRVGSGDLRVRIEATGLYTYPDIAVVCGEPRYEVLQGLRTLLNPTLLAEVLSESTEAYDRGRKFFHYRQIESLTDYLLIAQDAPRIEHFSRQSDGSWTFRAYDGLNAVVPIASLGCALPLSEIYENIEFPIATPAAPETPAK